jgi:8-oxo-dGTP pyrophosphatase MutT (NUDIX family)
MQPIPVNNAGIIIYTIENGTIKYLLLFSTQHTWSFPKGGIELDETIQQAALRELFEETKIVLPRTDPVFYFTESHTRTYETTTYFVTEHYYLGFVPDLSVTLDPTEHTVFLWCEFEQAFNLFQDRQTRKNALIKANTYLK